MSAEKILLGLTEVVLVVIYAISSIDIELLLIRKDDFGPFVFSPNMVHFPQNAFHLVIGCVEDCLLHPTVSTTTFTGKPSPDRLVTIFKGHFCCYCAHICCIFAHGAIDVPKRNGRDISSPPSLFVSYVSG